MRSLQNEAAAHCPNECDPFDVTYWSLVRADENPDLKAAILGGELNLVRCPECGTYFHHDGEIIYFDAPAELLVFVFSPKEYPSKEAFETEIVGLLDAAKVDLVCLAGYMRIVGDVLLHAYEGRIINIHPSLLPAFKGAHAVEQAVAYGVKVYGISIHWVNSDLDGGRIIAQRAFEYDGDDPAEVHRLGQKIEHELYVETISKLLK